MMGYKVNRKKNRREAFLPAPFALVLAAGGLLALSYLWMGGRCDALGRRIKLLEEQKDDLHRRVVAEQVKWSNAKSPSHIEQLLQRHRLVMSWPDEACVIRIRRPSEEPVSAEVPAAKRQYAQRVGS
ncbi:MAG: hypothetical protein NTV49_06565 [Kiritimatiellaeota bacterium]|nr:hypothetical protein [Kiritimatiellota bacterium]